MKKQALHDDYEQSYQLITSTERIQALLLPLIKKHNLATISMVGCEELYSSILLKSDPAIGEIVIDGLHPDEGNTRFINTGRLNLNTQLEGVQLQFSAELIKSLKENGFLHHVITYPKNIRYWQRRQAFRAVISSTDNINVQLQADDGSQCNGELFDISVGGICIRFPRKDSIPEEFTKDAVICSLDLPDKNHLRCSLEITHVRQNAPGKSLHVGAQFLKLDKIQHRIIQQFVTGVQRQQRQNAGA